MEGSSSSRRTKGYVSADSPIDQRVSVVVPRVVLHPERGEVELFVPLGEILIAELAVLDETTDIRGSFQTFGPHQAQFGALRLDTFETFCQLHGGALLVLLRERLHPLHDRVYSYLGFGGRRRTNVRGVFPVCNKKKRLAMGDSVQSRLLRIMRLSS